MKTLYYILLFVAALIFSTQFLVTRQYQRRNGTGFLSSVKLSLGAYFTIALFFFIKGCITYKSFNFGFSTFTFLMTLLIAAVSLSCVYMGIRVLAVGDMSIYSVFMMLGSLILPTFVGLVFYHESFGWIKGIAIALMLAAIVFSVTSSGKKVFTPKALICYIGIFIMNGMIGVLFTVHQNHPAQTVAAIANADGSFSVNNDAFMTWYGLSTVLLCGVLYAAVKIYDRLRRAKAGPAVPAPTETPSAEAGAACAVSARKISAKEVCLIILLPVLYGLCNGLGDYFIALATQPGALGSSVTFPIINGGTILFSTIWGMILYKEKLRPGTIAALVLVIVSTVLFMFA